MHTINVHAAVTANRVCSLRFYFWSTVNYSWRRALSTSHKLPIDEHKERILEKIRNARVTLLQGDTGCGKSTRVPLFLAEKVGASARIFVTQPRRLAARSLAKRLRESLGHDAVGVRLGHGVVDGISQDNRVVCGTAGYLSTLLLHRPDDLGRYTHLLIDEVHERSLDADMLCMLARKCQPETKIVLMSATVNAEQFCEYFKISPESVLRVGAHRFPTELRHLDDLASILERAASIDFRSVVEQFQKLEKQLESQINSLVKSGLSEHASRPCIAFPKRILQPQLKLVTPIIEDIARRSKGGEGILVFVSGIYDIGVVVDQLKYARIPHQLVVTTIHSSIPLEEQALAMEPAPVGTLKVVVATNSAESSLTIPDCNHVICLGTQKQIQWDSISNCAALVPSVISRASAVQRAGRSGRVRPGNVYRLYPKRLFDLLPGHEPPEVLRTPLEEIILRLRSSIDGPVAPLLLDLMDPPDIVSIDRMTRQLADRGILDSPFDATAKLTACGTYVAAMNVIDSSTALFLRDAYVLGMLPEALVIAAKLCIEKSIERDPMVFAITDPNEFALTTKRVVDSRIRLEGRSFCEHAGHINLVALLLENQTRFNAEKICRAVSHHTMASLKMIKLARSLEESFFRAINVAQSNSKQLSMNQSDGSVDERMDERFYDIDSRRHNRSDGHLEYLNTLYDHPDRLTLLRLLMSWAYAGTMTIAQPTKRSKQDGVGDVHVRFSRGQRFDGRSACINVETIDMFMEGLPGYECAQVVKMKRVSSASIPIYRLSTNPMTTILQSTGEYLSKKASIDLGAIDIGNKKFVLFARGEEAKRFAQASGVKMRHLVVEANVLSPQNIADRIEELSSVRGKDTVLNSRSNALPDESIDRIYVSNKPIAGCPKKWMETSNSTGDFNTLYTIESGSDSQTDIHMYSTGPPIDETDVRILFNYNLIFNSKYKVEGNHNTEATSIRLLTGETVIDPIIIDSNVDDREIQQLGKSLLSDLEPTFTRLLSSRNKPCDDDIRLLICTDYESGKHFAFESCVQPYYVETSKQLNSSFVRAKRWRKDVVWRKLIAATGREGRKLAPWLIDAIEGIDNDGRAQLSKHVALLCPCETGQLRAFRLDGTPVDSYFQSILGDEICKPCINLDYVKLSLKRLCSNASQTSSSDKLIRKRYRDVSPHSLNSAVRVLAAAARSQPDEQIVHLNYSAHRVWFPSALNWSLYASQKPIQIVHNKFAFTDSLLPARNGLPLFATFTKIVSNGIQSTVARGTGATVYPAGDEFVALSMRVGALTLAQRHLLRDAILSINDCTRADQLARRLDVHRQLMKPDTELTKDLLQLFKDWIPLPTPHDHRVTKQFIDEQSQHASAATFPKMPTMSKLSNLNDMNI